MQISSRIHIKVKDKSCWEKLYDIKTQEYYLVQSGKEVFKNCNTDFVVDGDWGCPGKKLEELVNEIVDRLGENVLIIADYEYINVDDNKTFIYYLGDGVKVEHYETWFSEDEYYNEDGEYETPWKYTDINNILECLRDFFWDFQEPETKEEEFAKTFGYDIYEED